ncbi:MAG: hypothetical protein JWO31_3, partial [Phycisphaerales bacterium]|nr:hypothetical protein [Phycisphaerales bacterium]
ALSDALQKLQGLEQDFAAASQKPLADQPLADLRAGYERVAATPNLTEMAKRIAESRLATLKFRADARDQLAADAAARAANMGKLTAQQAEHDEIRQNLKRAEMTLYAVVGVVRPSSLQVARTPIYRVTDPQDGRTLAYVWGTDPKVAAGEGRFVGVRGSVKTDPRFNFKVVTPTAVDPIDPANLNVAYAAETVPPSLQPKGATATTVTPEQ